MIKAGIFTTEDKVELLFGKIVPISPVAPLRVKAVNKINRLFSRQLSEDYVVTIQNP